MKKTKKIILIFISLFIIIGITYATGEWKAGGGVKWIGETNQSDRFTGPTNIANVSAYTDTYTDLKWQASGSLDSFKWANEDSSPEPTWNGDKYVYGSDRNASDYPAFKYCTDLGTGWRLPTKREMFSIMTDVKPTNMSYYTALPSIANGYYWSSSVYADYTTYAWYGDFNFGTTYDDSKDEETRVLCIHD